MSDVAHAQRVSSAIRGMQWGPLPALIATSPGPLQVKTSNPVEVALLSTGEKVLPLRCGISVDGALRVLCITENDRIAIPGHHYTSGAVAGSGNLPIEISRRRWKC